MSTPAKELSSLLFLYAETPLHAGSGAALGAVDLPVQRERMSGLPVVQGSGIKGALRAELNARHDESEDDRKAWEPFDRALFGRKPPERREDAQKERDNDKSGALSLLDARLLLLPVRTVWGGFAWVTCPMILQRLLRDLDLAGVSPPKVPDWRALDAGKAYVSQSSTVAKQGSLIIEDLEYPTDDGVSWVGELAAWLRDNALPQGESYKPFGGRLAGQLVIVSDEELQFLSERSTEVVTRVRINPSTGTVEDGALWTEESLPAETLLWSVGFFANERPSRKEYEESQNKDEKKQQANQRKPEGAKALQEKLQQELSLMKRIRIGGDRTTGRGIVGVHLVSNGGAK